ncbi:sigma-70 RNA polymerase sigma factor region 4 domain-containing protein [Clostridium saccharoperbutylacetonicum]
MDRKDIFEQTKKDLKGFKTLIGKLKVNRLTLEKDTLLNNEQSQLLEKSIKLDEIKIEKMKAALELLNEMDLKIITGSFFEKIRNKDIAINLNVSLDTVYGHKKEAIEYIAEVMYGHLLDNYL